MANIKRVLDSGTSLRLELCANLKVASNEAYLTSDVDRDRVADVLCRAIDEDLVSAELLADVVNSVARAVVDTVKTRRFAARLQKDVEEQLGLRVTQDAERTKLASGTHRLAALAVDLGVVLGADLAVSSFLREDLRLRPPRHHHLAEAKERHDDRQLRCLLARPASASDSPDGKFTEASRIRSDAPFSTEHQDEAGASTRRLIASHLHLRLRDPRGPELKAVRSPATTASDPGIAHDPIEPTPKLAAASRPPAPEDDFGFIKARAGVPITPREAMIEILSGQRSHPAPRRAIDKEKAEK